MKRWTRAIAVGACLLISGGAGAQAGTGHKDRANDILTGLMMAASDVEMCGESVLASRIHQAAAELIAFNAAPTEAAPSLRKWQRRVTEYRELQQDLMGIRGKPTSTSQRQFCESSVQQAHTRMHRSDDYIMRSRR